MSVKYYEDKYDKVLIIHINKTKKNIILPINVITMSLFIILGGFLW